MPLSIFVGQIFTDSEKKDKGLIALHEQANDAIKIFRDAKATAENCQQLRQYLEIILVDILSRPQSDAKDELYTAISDRIDTLKTGIELSKKRETYNSTLYQPKEDDKYKGWRSPGEQYELVRQQYLTNGNYKFIKKQTNPNTIEGFIRSRPDVYELDADMFIQKYGQEIFNSIRLVDKKGQLLGGDDLVKRWDYYVRFIVKKLVFVHITNPARIVIENRYPEADEMFTVMEEN